MLRCTVRKILKLLIFITKLDCVYCAVRVQHLNMVLINLLTPNDPYMGRTASLTSKRCILYIYSTNICTEYFKHALYSPFFSLQNAVCFIMLTCLVHVLFIFYIQDVLKLKKNNSGAKGLILVFEGSWILHDHKKGKKGQPKWRWNCKMSNFDIYPSFVLVFVYLFLSWLSVLLGWWEE
jgi:hypothetical protein